MAMVLNIPLMALALLVYNLIIAGFLGAAGAAPFAAEMSSVGMMSGAVWTLTAGDMMILFGLFLLFLEIIKATRVGSGSVADHLLSTLVFIAFLVEFLLVGGAATGVFFILMVMSLVDVLAGFTVSVRAATRDVALGNSL